MRKSVAAGRNQAICGTVYARTQQELFLHARNMDNRSRRRQAAGDTSKASALRSAQDTGLDRDIGDIAVIESTGGVIAARNSFNLIGSTVSFLPGPEGYSVETVESGTYDETAATEGLRLDLEDDDTLLISLPFAFPFFGTTYQDAWVNSNGSLSFTRGQTEPDFLYFGEFPAGPPSIAPLYTDMVPDRSSSGVRLLTEPGRVVLSWDGVPLFFGSAATGQRFQIRIYPDGRIEFAYEFANPLFAVTGITAGGLQPADLVDFLTAEPGPYPGGIAESFTSLEEVDMVSAAQRFYRTHEDAYDFLVFYNAAQVDAGPGTVAYELTTRSVGTGFGDTPIDWGATFGSPKQLNAVLNLGPVEQFPLDPDALIPSRRITGDTPLSVLAHEVGHLWLALASVPHPLNPDLTPPMLSADEAHWGFPFNSEASLLEGNRIVDNGEGANPRFRTTATVEHFSPLDQYLMGLREPSEVPPTFAILNSGQFPSRAPQAGVGMNGTRLDIGIEDVIDAVGRRTPDATVAQRRFRLGFVVIVEEGADLSPGSPASQAVAQVEEYRRRFADYFDEVTGGRGQVATELVQRVDLSLHPAAGITIEDDRIARLSIQAPQAEPLTFALTAPQGVLSLPAEVTIPAGQTSVDFNVTGNRPGVEELTAAASSASFATAHARVQVNPQTELHLEVAAGDRQPVPENPSQPLPEAIQILVTDVNRLPYPGQSVSAFASDGGSVEPAVVETDQRGIATFLWTPAPGSTNTLTASLTGVPSVRTTAVALGPPAIWPGGVVHAASFAAHLAPGAFGSIFGASLSGETDSNFSAPFPTAFEDVRVSINGILAELVFLSGGQINFRVPETLPRGQAEVTVETALGTSNIAMVPVDSVAPGVFFTPSTGYGAVLIAGTAQRTEDRPVQAGEFLEIYLTGLGSSGPGVERSVTATIGGVPVNVSYVGETQIDGLQQVNVQVSAAVPAGAQPLVISANGVASNTVLVQVATAP